MISSRRVTAPAAQKCRMCGCEETRTNKLIEQFYPNVGIESGPDSKERNFICSQCSNQINVQNIKKEDVFSIVVKEEEEENPLYEEVMEVIALPPGKFHTKNRFGNDHTIATRKFICKTCKKVLVSKQSCLEHLTIHTGEKPFQCKICSKSYRLQKHLTRHSYTHIVGEDYKCKKCDEMFGSKIDLINHNKEYKEYHMKKVEPTSPTTQYKYNKCNSVYADEKSLVKHELSHRNQTFACQICLKVFSKKQYLSKHIDRHMEWLDKKRDFSGKPPTVSGCKKESMPKDCLKNQTEERPFVCGTCFKAFKYKPNLKVHMTIHTAVKKFKCKDCQEGFTNYHSLVYHVCSNRPLK